MSHKKKTLEERQAELRQRAERKNAEPDQAQLKRRLEVLRASLGLTQAQMAAEFGVSKRYYEQLMQGVKPIKLAYVKLAERMANTNRVYKHRARAKQAAEVPIPENIPDNTQLRAKAISMCARGIPLTDIARELALRPEVVEYWTAGLRA